jgi:hypothetical protein
MAHHEVVNSTISISSKDKHKLTNKYFCSNCCKHGHVIKQCHEPITSFGIFCFTLSDDIKYIFNNSLSDTHYYDLDDNNNINISNILKFNKYNKMIKFLLVKRKHSLNYIDFVRGKYDISDTQSILNMLNHMSRYEIDILKKNNFVKTWSDLWQKTANVKMYNNEMIQSNKKFNELNESGILSHLIEISSPYDTPEWEIPKGRKEFNETNIMCAIREFKEETSFDLDDYTILNCINPIHDSFIGTNNKEYKHVFYIASANNTVIKPINFNNEIDEIKWCYWDEAISLIRPYNENKITLLTNIFLFIVNKCEQNSDSSDEIVMSSSIED